MLTPVSGTGQALPDAIVAVLVPFAALFTSPTWRRAQVLLVGAILTPGQRTVAAALRVMGRSDHHDYARYHEVLNRAVWSPREAARILLILMLQYLDRGDGPLVFGIDETLERRRGPRIRARGIYRDAVRSSRHQLVKASGLRWISLMWLGHVPWAGRYWALPVLSVLAPSERYHRQQGLRHKKLTDWARQMILQLRRWLPQRPLVLVGDNGYAVLDLLHRCQSLAQPVTLIARLRLDAALYAPAPPRQPRQNGRPPLKGARRPSLKALLDQPQTTWADTTVAWYDGTTRTVELTSRTAVWYRSGKPPVPIRWVLIRDPPGLLRPAGPALHRPGGGPCTDPAMVRVALATGSYFPGGANSPGRRDPAPVVRPGHRTHHSDPAGSVLLDHPGRPRLAEPEPHDPAHRGLVRQAVADLRGRRRPGAAAPVAGVGGFFTVGRRPRYSGTPRRSVPPTCRLPRLRRLKCVKSSSDEKVQFPCAQPHGTPSLSQRSATQSHWRVIICGEPPRLFVCLSGNLDFVHSSCITDGVDQSDV